MNPSDIAFPNLNIYLKDVPRSITIFNGFDVMLYGIIIGCAMLLCVIVAAYDRDSRGLRGDDIWDLAIIGIISGVLGARIYYVIFSWDNYRGNIKDILNIRNGGLAIYGGVIGGFLATIIFAKVKKLPCLELADSVALVFPLGQLMGRWGNFFNREAFGGWCENLFAMRLPIDAVRRSDISADIASHIVEGMEYIDVHPTFLYESAWNTVLFIGLFLYRKNKKFSGEIIFLYLFFYGLGRFFIEAMRTDQLLIPYVNLPVSRVVALVCMVFSATVISVTRLRKNRLSK